jgi:hypothetical protein
MIRTGRDCACDNREEQGEGKNLFPSRPQMA